MNTLLDFGRVFLAIPIGVFGIQYSIYGHLEGGLPVVPPWIPGGSVLAYVAGAILLALSAGLMIKRYALLSAVLFGVFLFFCVLFLHTLHLHDIIHRGTDRTRAVEPMALAAAAWVLPEPSQQQPPAFADEKISSPLSPESDAAFLRSH